MTKTVSTKNTTFLKAVIKGVLISLTVITISVFLISFLLNKESMELESMDYAVMIGTLIAICAGCFSAVIAFRKQMILVSACTAAVTLLVLISITAVFFGGQYRAVGVTWLLGLGCSLAVALISLKILNKPNFYRKKSKW